MQYQQQLNQNQVGLQLNVLDNVVKCVVVMDIHLLIN